MKKPLIGITASFDGQNSIVITRHYPDWILQKGGIPFIIPYITDQQTILEYARKIDGLLLSGGGDIDPTLFDVEPHPGLGSITPERDQLEMMLTQEILNLDKPILAICRGCQILNIAAGGTMFQDLTAQYTHAELIQHDQNAPTWHPSHTIDIKKNSKLSKILQVEQCQTNSFHHQAIKDPASSFEIVAEARDGVIEAIESTIHSYVIGVQWHPECKKETDPISNKLFHSFTRASTGDT